MPPLPMAVYYQAVTYITLNQSLLQTGERGSTKYNFELS